MLSYCILDVFYKYCTISLRECLRTLCTVSCKLQGADYELPKARTLFMHSLTGQTACTSVRIDWRRIMHDISLCLVFVVAVFRQSGRSKALGQMGLSLNNFLL